MVVSSRIIAKVIEVPVLVAAKELVCFLELLASVKFRKKFL